MLLGTPGYLAPEQAHGESVTERADLFSLGCVLYEMLPGTGRSPAQRHGDLARWPATLPVAPHEVDATVPRPLSNLVMRLLAQDPNNRPSSAAAVAEALRALEAGARVKPGRLWPLLVGFAAAAALLAVLAPLILRIKGPDGKTTVIEVENARSAEYDSKTGKVTINPLVPPDRQAPPADPAPPADTVYEVREGWLWSRVGSGEWKRSVRIKQTLQGPDPQGAELTFYLTIDGRVVRKTTKGFRLHAMDRKVSKMGLGVSFEGLKATLVLDPKGGVHAWSAGGNHWLATSDVEVSQDVDLNHCWVTRDRSLIARKTDGTWWRFDSGGSHALTSAKRLPDGQSWLLEYKDSGKRAVNDADGQTDCKQVAELGDKSILIQKSDGSWWHYEAGQRIVVVSARQLPDKKSWFLAHKGSEGWRFLYDADGQHSWLKFLELRDRSILIQKENGSWWRYAPDGRHLLEGLTKVRLVGDEQPASNGVGRILTFQNGAVIYWAPGMSAVRVMSKDAYARWLQQKKDR